MIEVEIRESGIKLGQFLKLAGAVDMGSDAKVRVQAGEVKVNGIIETRRGKKLNYGDRIEIAGNIYVVVQEGQLP
jgi:ribosome-associated protein